MSYVIDQISSSYKISEYLADKGIHPKKEHGDRKMYPCPLPSHTNDSHPSFYLFDKGDHEDFHCFGCIEANEPVWTEDGLVSIGEIQVGNRVLGIDGKYHPVSHVSRKNKPISRLRLAAFKDPLSLTLDHKCIVLKKNDALKNLPYINRRSDSYGKRSERYMQKSRRLASYGDRIHFTEQLASEVEEGDFFAFPVIPLEDRHQNDLKSTESVRSYTSGPRVRDISLLATEKMAYFYGLYLAEGSISGRTLRLTMSLSELPILKRIQAILKEEIGLESSVYPILTKNVSELICSSIDLIDQMVYFFGKGCSEKHIPGQILSWTTDLQKSLLKGYKDGDADITHRNSISVSRNLSYGLFALSIQCEELACVSDRRISKQRDDSIRKDSWSLTYRKRQGLNAFYEHVGSTKYFFSRVDSIVDSNELAEVIDLTVPQSESFTTKLGVVHNCKAGGGIIQFVSEFENISIKDSISKLASSLNLNVEDAIDHIVAELTNVARDVIVDENDLLHTSMFISRISHEHLRRCDFDPAELAACEKMFKLVDKFMIQQDQQSIEEISSLLPTHLRKRFAAYTKKKSAEERESMTSWEI